MYVLREPWITKTRVCLPFITNIQRLIIKGQLSYKVIKSLSSTPYTSPNKHVKCDVTAVQRVCVQYVSRRQRGWLLCRTEQSNLVQTVFHTLVPLKCHWITKPAYTVKLLFGESCNSCYNHAIRVIPNGGSLLLPCEKTSVKHDYYVRASGGGG